MTQARGFFERALALDPGNIEALVGTARVDVSTGASFFDQRPDREFYEGRDGVDRGSVLAPQHAFAHSPGLSPNCYEPGGAGIAECERALALDRNLAHAHAFIGLGK